MQSGSTLCQRSSYLGPTRVHLKQKTKDCYHTSTAHLLHLHFICCPIIPRPAPFYDPSCLSAPPPFCLFTSSSISRQALGRQGLWAPESVPHQALSFFASTKTTPTYPLTGEENFLLEEEQLQVKQTMLTPPFCRQLVLQVDQVHCKVSFFEVASHISVAAVALFPFVLIFRNFYCTFFIWHTNRNIILLKERSP